MLKVMAVLAGTWSRLYSTASDPGLLTVIVCSRMANSVSFIASSEGETRMSEMMALWTSRKPALSNGETRSVC